MANFNSSYGISDIPVSGELGMIARSASANSALSQSYAREQMAFQDISAIRAMDFSALEAAKNRDWQAYMSNTAHQREVNDLIAAGLNPVLSASGGNGAAVGSGATAQSFAPSGASGTVDNSLSAAIPQLFNSVLNAQVQLESQKNSAAVQKYIADLEATTSETNNIRDNATATAIGSAHDAASRYATDGSRASKDYATNTDAIVRAAIAQANIEANRELEKMKEEHDEYIHQFYPSSVAGIASSMATGATKGIVGILDSIFKPSSNSSTSASSSSYTYHKDFDLDENIKNTIRGRSRER